MISILKNLIISDLNAPSDFPVSYAWISSNPCVQFNPQAGLSYDGTIDTVVSFENESCINSSVISISVTPHGGCNKLTRIAFTNPCQSFSIGAITHASPFTYVIIPTAGYPGYTYTWNYSTTVFNKLSQTSANTHGAIVLELNNDMPLPSSTIISVTVTDSNGCSRTAYYTQYLDPPQITNSTILARYTKSTTSATAFQYTGLQLNVHQTSFPIDWESLQFVLPPGVTYEQTSPGIVNIYLPLGLHDTTQSITYTVNDVYGITSNAGTITATVPGIPVQPPPLSQDRVIVVSSDTIVGDEFEVQLEEVISPLAGLDWNTFTVVNTPDSGTTTYDAGNRKLIYEVTDMSNPVDKVDWTIRDINNNRSNKGTLYINFEIDDAPVAVNNTICATCGNSSGFIDLTANDTGVIDKRTMLITQYPLGTQGSVAIDSVGNVAFSALPTYYGTSTFKYKVANWDQQYSNEGTVTVNVVCSGLAPTGAIDVTCYSNLQFNLSTLVGGYVSTGASWTEIGAGTPYATEGGTITGGYLGTVNFTGMPANTYTFRASITSGGCTSQTVVNVLVTNVPYIANNLCSGAYILGYPTTTSSSAFLVNQDNGGNCPVYKAATESAITSSPSTPEQIPTSWTVTRGGDVWFKFTVGSSSPTACSIKVDGTAYGLPGGIVNPQLAVYTSAGTPCAINDFSLFADGAQTSGSQTVTKALTGLSTSTTYWVRVSSGGSNHAGRFDIILTT